MSRRRGVRAAVLMAAVSTAAVLGACSPAGTGGYHLAADFTQGIGLYPGSPVRVLGITVGRITDVTNRGSLVRVEMQIDRGTRLAADAKAAIVPVTLLGERYIQFAPVYTGGPSLAAGSVLPTSRTEVPIEIDQLLKGLKDFFGAINPQNAHDLVSNLATIVDGEGQQLNSLINNAAGTVNVLAVKGQDLGTLVDSLAQLTSALDSRTTAIERLVSNYNTVSAVLAQNKDALNDTITQLNRTATELADLITAHQDPLKQDVGVITTAGRTLDRNIDSLNTTLASTVKLFSAAGRAYDPTHNWLPLSTQLPPDVTSEVAAARLRDRLAGVCRRLAVKLGPNPPAPLTTCGNVDSNFFDPILNQLPAILGSSSSSASAQSAITSQVLSKLPALTPAQQAKLNAPPPPAPPPSPASMLRPLLPPPPHRVAAKQSSPSLLSRLWHGILGVF